MKITAPQHRLPFSESKQVFPPCAKAAVGARTVFPIQGGAINMTSYHTTATVSFELALTADPKEADFLYTVIPVRSIPRGKSTLKEIDLRAAVGSDVQLVDGAVATLRFKFDGGDGTLYDCSDIILKDTTPVVTTTTTTIATTTTTDVVTLPETSTSVGTALPTPPGLLF
ncbi:hypothetical protein HDU97_002243 [Phlyctochytrium planicorne]|nr:hypothetical protein HDU97_002243 [Phlyctochytrium planicorne]